MHPWSPSIERADTDDTTVDLDDRGLAALEFIVVGLLLLVPLVYVIVTLAMIQGQALGVEAGARHVARAVAGASDASDADRRAERVLASVAGEYGIDPDRLDLSLECAPAGSACPRAGATLLVGVRSTVALPLVPPVFGLDRIAVIPVEAMAAQRVSRFWEGG
ncbi:TadE family protein [Microbacterium sp. ET2]|uniref:TadE family protein n=1 Tax=Microbacterium albipurpureum TaxID=3050384 RepID=UPI00259D14FE|nr:TadE family protein [Microbacterium sp. ET2 (Ac-2212)]WJL95855.1 TadE family protein [Microbacterium sp. ET2 (Ac-2212)]